MRTHSIGQKFHKVIRWFIIWIICGKIVLTIKEAALHLKTEGKMICRRKQNYLLSTHKHRKRPVSHKRKTIKAWIPTRQRNDLPAMLQSSNVISVKQSIKIEG